MGFNFFFLFIFFVEKIQVFKKKKNFICHVADVGSHVAYMWQPRHHLTVNLTDFLTVV